uniref:Protein-tyrosine-phosphatase n=1 Tax=Cyprinus carpio TaxID=7962 RepID=A0A8C1PAC9_CYPCA
PLFILTCLLQELKVQMSVGDCDFKKPFSSCGYTQGRDDELDWEQIDTSEKPSLDPWVRLLNILIHFIFPLLNIFIHLVSSRLFLCSRLISALIYSFLEYLDSSHPISSLNTPHFLHIKGVEVNAGQTATFLCTLNGEWRDSFNLWLQVRRTANSTITKAFCEIWSDSLSCCLSASYLWRELWSPLLVEYRTVSGTMYDLQPVDKTSHKIGHLDPDTEYEISVLLTRPLEGGTGAPGPPLRARTKCAEPMHDPQQLQVVDIEARQVTLRWEPLGYNVTRCHNYSLTVQYRARGGGKEESREEAAHGSQHTIHNLSPFTNLSVRMLLRNREGVKESPEIHVQTDEDVPGEVPLDSIQASVYEDKILLKWREPAQTFGIITQYEISYKAVSSFDPVLDLSNLSGKVVKLGNETSHVFLGLYPGSTSSFTIRASTAKGFGPPAITQATTKISAPLMPVYDQETPLNQTDSTVTVVLKPAQMMFILSLSLSLSLSVYQVVVEEERPRRARGGGAEILRCYPLPVHYHNASGPNSRYYYSAEFPSAGVSQPQTFTIGDNRTYGGYWNAPLLPHKSYSIYYQAVSAANGETKIDCVRVATKGAATHKPNAVEPEKQTDHTVKIAGIIAGILLFVIIFLGVVLLMKKRLDIHNLVHCFLSCVADETQTLTSDTSSLVQSHTHTHSSHTHSLRKREAVDVPYHTGQLHPAIRVADLLQHITQMKCAEGYGFKEEYEVRTHRSHHPQQCWGKSLLKVMRYNDHSRVRLQNLDGEQNSDYINANYVDGYHRPNHYIATQGPMQETAIDFWRMVWQENTATIVMVTNLVEVGRVSVKVCVCANICIICLLRESQDHSISLSVLQRGAHEIREISQFHFTGWPDHGVPYHATGLLGFVRRVKAKSPPNAGPIVVHCRYQITPHTETLANTNITVCTQTSFESIENLNHSKLYLFIYLFILYVSCSSSLCQSYKQPSAFIVTQHPLPNTVKDFWRLVLDYHCTSIVMLNDVDPAQVRPMLLGVHLLFFYYFDQPQDGYRMVQQFQFLGWPMYRDTPVSKRSFLKLIRQVDKWQEEYDGGEGRTVVHCLNGGGRSGTFCAISIVSEMLRHQRSVDVFHAVKTLRNNKPNMVDLLDQYKFCYEVALEYLNSG